MDTDAINNSATAGKALQPLLQEYVQGMYDEEGIMSRFAKAYGYRKLTEGDSDEAAQN